MKPAVSRRPRRIVAIAVAVVALAVGAAGAASSQSVAGSPCTTASGLPGTVVVWTDSNGVATSWCQYTPPSEALPVLVLNEIDYDQVGADGGGFVELHNAGHGPADLEGLALVLVDGADGLEYLRKPPGTLAAGAYLGVPSRRRTARRTASRSSTHATRALLDALSYEGAINAPSSARRTTSSSRATTLPPSVADSNTVEGVALTLPGRQRHERRGDRLGVHDDRRRRAARRMCRGRASARPLRSACSRAPPRLAFTQRFFASAWRRLSSRRSRWASSRCSFL